MAAQDLPDQTARLTILLGADEKQRLEAIAYEASAPGNNVATSQVVREAIRAYLEDVPGADAPQEHVGFQTAAEALQSEAGE